MAGRVVWVAIAIATAMAALTRKLRPKEQSATVVMMSLNDLNAQRAARARWDDDPDDHTAARLQHRRANL